MREYMRAHMRAYMRALRHNTLCGDVRLNSERRAPPAPFNVASRVSTGCEGDVDGSIPPKINGNSVHSLQILAVSLRHPTGGRFPPPRDSACAQVFSCRFKPTDFSLRQTNPIKKFAPLLPPAGVFVGACWVQPGLIHQW